MEVARCAGRATRTYHTWCATCFGFACGTQKILVLAERSFLQHVPAQEARARAVRANCILLRPTMLKMSPLSEKVLAGTRKGMQQHQARRVLESTKKVCGPGFFAAFALLWKRGDSLIPSTLRRKTTNQNVPTVEPQPIILHRRAAHIIVDRTFSLVSSCRVLSFCALIVPPYSALSRAIPLRGTSSNALPSREQY